MLTYDMQRRGGMSLYEYLYFCVRRDIEAGTIAANEKLPSKRALAKHLGVSLVTIEGAYTQLLAEGYIYAIQRKGYFASDVAPFATKTSGMRFSRGRGGDAESVVRESGVSAHEDQEQMFHVKHSSFYGGAESAFVGEGAVEENPAHDVYAEEREALGHATAEGRGAFGRTLAGECSALGHAFAGEPSALGCANAGGCAASGGLSRGSRPLIADFTGTTAPRGLFPYKAWARVVRETLSCESEETLLAASGTMGSLRLRQALSDYLRGQRGMNVSPDQIVVGAGAQTLYNMLVQLLGRERHVAVEEPGYPRLTQIYLSNDVALSHVALDEAGVSMSSLRESGADVLHCMPSHQLPTGLVMPIGRRREILRWAAEADGRYIIEDDYDCEFRMAGRPIPSLQGIDEMGTVIYTNTFTNSLGPTFRIGYMVLPEHLARRFHERLGFYSCTVGAIEQVSLARYIESGDYERHVNRMRSHFRRVQESLVAGLQASSVASRLRFRNVGAGLHFVMEVDADASAEELAERALRRGVALAPLERYWLGDNSRDVERALRFGECSEARIGRGASDSARRSEGPSCCEAPDFARRSEARFGRGASDSAEHSEARIDRGASDPTRRPEERFACGGDSSGRLEGRSADYPLRGSRSAAFVMSFSSVAEEAVPDVVRVVEECFT